VPECLWLSNLNILFLLRRTSCKVKNPWTKISDHVDVSPSSMCLREFFSTKVCKVILAGTRQVEPKLVLGPLNLDERNSFQRDINYMEEGFPVQKRLVLKYKTFSHTKIAFIRWGLHTSVTHSKRWPICTQYAKSCNGSPRSCCSGTTCRCNLWGQNCR
jgi:hypothetical protein